MEIAHRALQAVIGQTDFTVCVMRSNWEATEEKSV